MLQFEITKHAKGNSLRLDVIHEGDNITYSFRDYFSSWSYDGVNWNPINWQERKKNDSIVKISQTICSEKAFQPFSNMKDLFLVKVDCYSGFKADEYPVRFYLDDIRFEIEEVLDRWYQGTLTLNSHRQIISKSLQLIKKSTS